MPSNLALWEKIVFWAVNALLWGGGGFLCYWIYRKVIVAFQQGMQEGKERRR